MKDLKIGRRLRAYGISMRALLTVILILFGMFPLLIQGKVLAGSFQQEQLDGQSIELQNQCVILSNKMTRAEYLQAEHKDGSALDAQMQTLADVYNGRIVLVNQSFRVIKDTFNLSVGKFYISEEVIRCFQGENSSRYNREMNYSAHTIPVYNRNSPDQVDGVMVVTASTEKISTDMENLEGKVNFFLLLALVVLTAAAVGATYLLMGPLRRLQGAFNQAAQGDLETDIMVDTYRETRRLSQAVNKSLSKLKAVDQSRQEFVSNVSHELKTPMTSMKVLADSLVGQENVPVELYQEFMQDIAVEIDRENKIITDLLSLVKMDKKASDLNIAEININQLLENILKRLKPIAEAKQVELILESYRPVVAEVDEVKLSLALSNLVENGIKYNSEDGWVRVTLNADHKYFYVSVADSGIGIPEESIDRIFERFYRVDKSHSREIGGTGLGLAITRNAIVMHRGAIKVKSEEHKGTTFSVRIPLTYIA